MSRRHLRLGKVGSNGLAAGPVPVVVNRVDCGAFSSPGIPREGIPVPPSVLSIDGVVKLWVVHMEFMRADSYDGT